MEITCLGTGSSGNCYIINQEGITYLLDAGVDFRKIMANVNLNDVEFAFISHEHKDHSLNLEKLENRRVKTIYGKLINKFTKMAITSQNKVNITIYTFPIHHGECKNSALIVQTENECLLYATDFSLCEYNLKKLKFTHIMVECNFDEELMRKAPQDYKHIRQFNTHMGFKGLQTFIDKAIDTEPIQEIILIHLSTEIDLVDREILSLKAQARWRGKKIGIAKQRGGVDWYGR